MAARKSCKTMTWAEAKNKCGVGGSKNPNKAGLRIGQQPNHGALLAAKIIAKGGPGEDERVKNRQAFKTAKKDAQRQEELNRKRELEKERKRLEDVVRPHEKAMEKLKELEVRFHDKADGNGRDEDCDYDHNYDYDSDPDKMNLICESKQLQLDEVLALEAIYADTDVLKVSAASQLESLQEKIEAWQEDPDSIDSQIAVARHPSLSYTLTRSIDDPDDEDEDRAAHLLFHVVYPSDYPLESTPPRLRILWCLVTQKSLVVSSNKPLESLGILDEEGLLGALSTEAEESLLGMPVVYELLDAWLGERLFGFIQNVPSRDKK